MDRFSTKVQLNSAVASSPAQPGPADLVAPRPQRAAPPRRESTVATQEHRGRAGNIANRSSLLLQSSPYGRCRNHPLLFQEGQSLGALDREIDVLGGVTVRRLGDARRLGHGHSDDDAPRAQQRPDNGTSTMRVPPPVGGVHPCKMRPRAFTTSLLVKSRRDLPNGASSRSADGDCRAASATASAPIGEDG
jgi:hypothetical protein